MRKVKVWDAFVRLFHWGLGALVLGSFLTSDVDALVPVHVGVGILVVSLVVARVIWGFVGSRPARFRTFVRGPRETMAYAGAMVRGRPPRHLSHNPLGGAMVVALLGTLAAIAVTGVVVAAGPEFGGPLGAVLTRRSAKAIKEVHEALSGALVVLVAVHVVGVIVSSLVERQNLVAGMITGWKRAPVDAADACRRERAWRLRLAGATALAIAAAAAIGLAMLLGFPGRAHAGAPETAALLREYEALVATASAHDGRSDRRHERGRGGVRIDATYAKECGACHVAYPPGLLPAASWRRIMGGLSAHFGDVAELEPEVRAGLERWLVERAGPESAAAPPTRITHLPWFVREHREVPAAALERPGVRSFSNCAACHPGAERWDFDDDRVKIPR